MKTKKGLTLGELLILVQESRISEGNPLLIMSNITPLLNPRVLSQDSRYDFRDLKTDSIKPLNDYLTYMESNPYRKLDGTVISDVTIRNIAQNFRSIMSHGLYYGHIPALDGISVVKTRIAKGSRKGGVRLHLRGDNVFRVRSEDTSRKQRERVARKKSLDCVDGPDIPIFIEACENLKAYFEKKNGVKISEESVTHMVKIFGYDTDVRTVNQGESERLELDINEERIYKEASKRLRAPECRELLLKEQANRCLTKGYVERVSGVPIGDFKQWKILQTLI